MSVASEQPAEPLHVPAIPPPRFFFGASLAAVLFFSGWSWLALRSEIIPAFDLKCAQFWHAWSHDHPGPLQTMYFLTEMGGIASMTLVAIMGALWQSAIKNRVLAAAWLGVVIGGALLNMATKDLFSRVRPDADIRDRVVHENNHSYPSGHSMGSAIGYGMLGYALILPQRHRPRRVASITLMLAIVLGIGFSRLYLRAHWVSDVIGGWTIGLAWLFFCLGWLERHRRKQL